MLLIPLLMSINLGSLTDPSYKKLLRQWRMKTAGILLVSIAVIIREGFTSYAGRKEVTKLLALRWTESLCWNGVIVQAVSEIWVFCVFWSCWRWEKISPLQFTKGSRRAWRKSHLAGMWQLGRCAKSFVRPTYPMSSVCRSLHTGGRGVYIFAF